MSTENDVYDRRILEDGGEEDVVESNRPTMNQMIVAVIHWNTNECNMRDGGGVELS